MRQPAGMLSEHDFQIYNNPAKFSLQGKIKTAG
jgi:hypothetical protein